MPISNALVQRLKLISCRNYSRLLSVGDLALRGESRWIDRLPANYFAEKVWAVRAGLALRSGALQFQAWRDTLRRVPKWLMDRPPADKHSAKRSENPYGTRKILFV